MPPKKDAAMAGQAQSREGTSTPSSSRLALRTATASQSSPTRAGLEHAGSSTATPMETSSSEGSESQKLIVKESSSAAPSQAPSSVPSSSRPSSTKKKIPASRSWDFTHVPSRPEETSKNGRHEGRNLITWTRPRMAEKLLLHMQYECARHQVEMPWEKIAHRLNPGSSGGAIIQHLNRLRSTLIAEGHLVPPVCQRPNSNAPLDPAIRGFVRKYENTSDTVTTREVLFTEPMEDRKINLPDAFNPKGVSGSAKREQMGGPKYKGNLGVAAGKGRKRGRAEKDSDEPESDDEYTPTGKGKGVDRRRSSRLRLDTPQVESSPRFEDYHQAIGVGRGGTASSSITDADANLDEVIEVAGPESSNSDAGETGMNNSNVRVFMNMFTTLQKAGILPEATPNEVARLADQATHMQACGTRTMHQQQYRQLEELQSPVLTQSQGYVPQQLSSSPVVIRAGPQARYYPLIPTGDNNPGFGPAQGLFVASPDGLPPISNVGHTGHPINRGHDETITGPRAAPATNEPFPGSIAYRTTDDHAGDSTDGRDGRRAEHHPASSTITPFAGSAAVPHASIPTDPTSAVFTQGGLDETPGRAADEMKMDLSSWEPLEPAYTKMEKAASDFRY